MKKIVIVICVISIIMTSVVFSVSATEADTKETQIAVNKQERVTDSSYEEMSWSVECDTSPQSVPYEALSPEEKAEHEQWLAEQKAKDEEKIKEYRKENPRPLIAVTFRTDMDKYITSEVYEKAEAMVVAEIASSEKLDIDEVSVSINSEGKVVSETKITLPEEVIKKLATHYYEAYDLYQKATYGEAMYMFQDFVMTSCKYDKAAEVWLCVFRTDKEKYPEREGAAVVVVLRENGEFVGLG